MAKNPFRFGEKLLPEEVVDRQEEIGQIVQTIEDGKKLFLIGPRRHGKTVILHAAAETARQQGWRFCRRRQRVRRPISCPALATEPRYCRSRSTSA